ncbi:MAG: biotin transporter BioY [Clostridia bacterium]|nr:biotin transporter BioY [Clostridia bacterium]
MRSAKLKNLTKTALMVAVIAVLAQIVIPFSGVPLTLQTFAIAFCGYFLGMKLGIAAVLTYLLAGAIGLPVFAGFGATASLIGPTGGFLLGFLPLVFFCGTAKEKIRRFSFLFSTLGLVICHLFGVAWYIVTMKTELLPAWLLVSLPYLPKDILSLFLAKFFASRLQKCG